MKFLRKISNGMRKHVISFALMLLCVSNNSVANTQQSPLPQYRVNAGDMIQITVFGQADLSIVTRLPDNGIISYPFLGELNIANMTVTSIEGVIHRGLLGDYLINPSVQVTVIEYRPFFISGAVKQPGGYPFQPGLTIAKAAALAGGFTERAATRYFSVERQINGKVIDVTLAQIDAIQPGDIITVQQSFF